MPTPSEVYAELVDVLKQVHALDPPQKERLRDLISTTNFRLLAPFVYHVLHAVSYWSRDGAQ